MRHCLTCNCVIDEDYLIWDDPIVPTCPVCLTMDMLEKIPNVPLRCQHCETITEYEAFRGMKGDLICPNCSASLMVPETVVVTRHPALVDYLKEKGLVDKNTKVLTHANKEDIIGKNVIGILPIDLAAYANSITSVTMNLTEAHRGRELTLEDMKEIVGEIKTYMVVEL